MTPKAQATKESICKLHFIKLKTFKRTASTKRKDKPQNGSKHFQIIYVIKDLPVKYVRALKRKQSENKSLLQRGFLGGSVAGERGLHSFLKECWSGTAARGLTDLGSAGPMTKVKSRVPHPLPLSLPTALSFWHRVGAQASLRMLFLFFKLMHFFHSLIAWSKAAQEMLLNK